MKIRTFQKEDKRNIGNSPHLYMGFTIIAENEEEEKFIKDFEILHEDVNGYMEVNIELEDLVDGVHVDILTRKSW